MIRLLLVLGLRKHLKTAFIICIDSKE